MEILIIIYHHAQKGIHVTDKVQPYNNAHRYMTDERQFAKEGEREKKTTRALHFKSTAFENIAPLSILW